MLDKGKIYPVSNGRLHLTVNMHTAVLQLLQLLRHAGRAMLLAAASCCCCREHLCWITGQQQSLTEPVSNSSHSPSQSLANQIICVSRCQYISDHGPLSLLRTPTNCPAVLHAPKAASRHFPSLLPGGMSRPPKISPLKHSMFPLESVSGLVEGIEPLSCRRDAAKCNSRLGLALLLFGVSCIEPAAALLAGLQLLQDTWICIQTRQHAC